MTKEISEKIEAAKIRKEKRKLKRMYLGLPDRKKKRRKVKRPPNRAKRMKLAKKDGLRLWSLKVRWRDGKCIMCGKTEFLQAHHWLFRRSHSIRLSLDPANGATLCYGCHIGRVHHDGDGAFILDLAAKMTELVGPQKIKEMRETANALSPVSLEEVEAMVDLLK